MQEYQVHFKIKIISAFLPELVVEQFHGDSDIQDISPPSISHLDNFPHQNFNKNDFGTLKNKNVLENCFGAKRQKFIYYGKRRPEDLCFTGEL